MRGVVESFYGPPYSWPQRIDLIRFIAGRGFNAYLYAPKWDRRAGSGWRESYPPETMREFRDAVGTARGVGVDFGYAVSPSGAIRHSGQADLERLATKLGEFAAIGVRSFGLFFDDPPEAALRDPEDRRAYATYAAAHVDLANRLLARLRSIEPGSRLSVTPTDYHGRAPFSAYVHELGRGLDPDIDVFYTGPEICSRTITAADAAGFATAAGRKPLIWDNYPVNDLLMEPELHLGPIRGRDRALHEHVQGVMVNAGARPEMARIPLATFADYLAEPAAYSPRRSWRAAVRLVAGEAAGPVTVVARHTESSCLGTAHPRRLVDLVEAARSATVRGERLSETAAGRALEAYLAEIEDACDAILDGMANPVLRTEILPWVESLVWWIKAARVAGELVDLVSLGEPIEEKREGLAMTMRILGANGRITAGELLRPIIEAALAVASRA